MNLYCSLSLSPEKIRYELHLGRKWYGFNDYKMSFCHRDASQIWQHFVVLEFVAQLYNKMALVPLAFSADCMPTNSSYDMLFTFIPVVLGFFITFDLTKTEKKTTFHLMKFCCASNAAIKNFKIARKKFNFLSFFFDKIVIFPKITDYCENIT